MKCTISPSACDINTLYNKYKLFLFNKTAMSLSLVAFKLNLLHDKYISKTNNAW